MTPYQLFKNKKPTLNFLHVFGCKCYILRNQTDQHGKFDAKADEGIFVGYAVGKAYRVYNLRTSHYAIGDLLPMYLVLISVRVSVIMQLLKYQKDKSSTLNLKIEVLIFTRLVLASHSPLVFHPYIKVPVSALKEQIATVTGILSEQQRLICRGKAEFQNVIDSVTKFGKVVSLSASISWNPQRGDQQSSFAIGFNSDIPLLNSTKIQVFHLALGSLSVKTSFGSNQFIRIPQPYKFKVKVNSEGHGKVGSRQRDTGAEGTPPTGGRST
ncbi:hypothetical protein AgCh_009619 [Apium graveolens]